MCASRRPACPFQLCGVRLRRTCVFVARLGIKRCNGGIPRISSCPDVGVLCLIGAIITMRTVPLDFLEFLGYSFCCFRSRPYCGAIGERRSDNASV
jgi:hypothetical protein